MAPQAKATIWEALKWLLIPVLSAIVTASYAVGTFKGDFSRIEARVDANRQAQEQSLTNAIALRKADQALLIQKDVELERSLVIMQTAQKEVIAIMQGLAKDNASFREEAIRRLTTLDERIGYLAKSIEDIRYRKS